MLHYFFLFINPYLHENYSTIIMSSAIGSTGYLQIFMNDIFNNRRREMHSFISQQTKDEKCIRKISFLRFSECEFEFDWSRKIGISSRAI